jgi:hypothetical protein
MRSIVAATFLTLVSLILAPAVAFLTSVTRQPHASPWHAVASWSKLPADGEPVLLPVQVHDHDAWQWHPSRVVTHVFVRRLPESREVRALQCHHHGSLQVAVKYDEATKTFKSCWDVRFDLDGVELIARGFSPLGDRLEALPVRLFGDKVFVHFDVP